MTYTITFSAGEGNHFSGSVNYLKSTDGSIYAEISVPDGASEDYGYLNLKKAIQKQVSPSAFIVWYYDEADEKLLEADADVDTEVWTDIQIEEDDYNTVKYLVRLETREENTTEDIDHITAPAGYTAAQYIQDCQNNAPQEWVDMITGEDVERLYLMRYNPTTDEWEEVQG